MSDDDKSLVRRLFDEVFSAEDVVPGSRDHRRVDGRRRRHGCRPRLLVVAGAVILTETLAKFGLDEIELSERDILDRIALAAAELPETEDGAAPPGAYTCR